MLTSNVRNQCAVSVIVRITRVISDIDWLGFLWHNDSLDGYLVLVLVMIMSEWLQ